MVWSETHQCWCILIEYNSINILMGLVGRCTERFGPSIIHGVRTGRWGWSRGEYYGITKLVFDQELPDGRMYFSFKDKSDALVFKLTWG